MAAAFLGLSVCASARWPSRSGRREAEFGELVPAGNALLRPAAFAVIDGQHRVEVDDDAGGRSRLVRLLQQPSRQRVVGLREPGREVEQSLDVPRALAD